MAGENYRFGYKASGDTEELVTLCKEYGLGARIVKHVMDRSQLPHNGAISNVMNSNDKGQVSSTRIRHALAMGDMDHVTQLLGRKHRLVLTVNKEWRFFGGRRILAPKSSMLNLPPGNGEFDQCSLLVDDLLVAECRIVLDDENIAIELRGGSLQDMIREGQLIGIEFG